ncbi:MAG: hypothetical protein J5632_03530 [Bacteroidales bacterium]|nr:hypothetical protein [Bacteroidales bacterium]
MPMVIDLKEEITQYLKEQGYIPTEPNNIEHSDNELYQAILRGAAKCYDEWIGVNMAKEGYCRSDGAEKSLRKRILDAVSEVEGEMGVYNNTNNDNWTLIESYTNQENQ